MIEIWKDISGYDGLYKVSNSGRVRSLHPYNGSVERILIPYKMKTGHLQVTLCKNKIKKKYLIHRLVLEAFLGKCPYGMEGCHNDGNPGNNVINNLRYDTHQENIRDVKRHGRSTARKTSPAGMNNGFSKLVDNDVFKINKLLKGKELTQKEIAGIFNVHRSTITLINNRKTWIHI